MRFLFYLFLPFLLIWDSGISSLHIPQEEWKINSRHIRSPTDTTPPLDSGGDSNKELSIDDINKLSFDELEKLKNAAQTALAETEAKLKATREELETDVKEGAQPKKEYDAAKTNWETLNAIYEEMKKNKTRAEKANTEFETAKGNWESAEGKYNTTKDSLAKAQRALEDAKTTRDTVIGYPDRKIAAEAEQAGNKSAEPGLITAEGKSRSERDEKQRIVTDLQNRITGLEENELKENNCVNPPFPAGSPCFNADDARTKLKNQLGPAQTALTTANNTWTSDKEKLDKCRENLVKLKTEISQLKVLLNSQVYGGEVAGAKSDVFKKELLFNSTESEVNDAEKEMNDAKTILNEKSEAKRIADEAGGSAPVGYDEAQKSASKARSKLDIAETLWSYHAKRQKELNETIASLEKRVTTENNRYGTLMRVYEEKLKGKEPGKGNMPLIVGLIFLCACVIGAVVFGVFLWRKKHKKDANAEKGTVSKDAQSTTSVQQQSTVSQKPLDPDVPATSQVPDVKQEPVLSAPGSDGSAQPKLTDVKQAPALSVPKSDGNVQPTDEKQAPAPSAPGSDGNAQPKPSDTNGVIVVVRAPRSNGNPQPEPPVPSYENYKTKLNRGNLPADLQEVAEIEQAFREGKNFLYDEHNKALLYELMNSDLMRKILGCGDVNAVILCYDSRLFKYYAFSFSTITEVVNPYRKDSVESNTVATRTKVYLMDKVWYGMYKPPKTSDEIRRAKNVQSNLRNLRLYAGKLANLEKDKAEGIVDTQYETKKEIHKKNLDTLMNLLKCPRDMQIGPHIANWDDKKAERALRSGSRTLMSSQRRDELIRQLEVSVETRKTFEISDDELRGVLFQVMEIFKKEQMLIESKGEAWVVGDLHGSFGDLIAIIRSVKAETKNFDDEKFIFLGDYVDRGDHQFEVIMLLFLYKIRKPKNFILLRGNHESYNVNVEYGFYYHLVNRMGKNVRRGTEFHEHFNVVFSYMSIACHHGSIQLNHGGISEHLEKLSDLNKISKPLPDLMSNPIAQDLTWADPAELLEGFKPNATRGVSSYFGKDELKKYAKKIGISLVIRGHQKMTNGHEPFCDDGLLQTVFSCSDYEDGKKNTGAIARINNTAIMLFHLFTTFQGVIEYVVEYNGSHFSTPHVFSAQTPNGCEIDHSNTTKLEVDGEEVQ